MSGGEKMLYRKIQAQQKAETCPPMFITALFTAAERWKQPSVHRGMNGSTKCDMYMQRNIIPKNKGKSDTYHNMDKT